MWWIQLCSILIVGGAIASELLVDTLSDRVATQQRRRLFESNIEGTSGKLFEGKVVNHFNDSLVFKSLSEEQLNQKRKLAMSSRIIKPFANGRKCNMWAVVTTINPPTDAVERQSRQADWCLVVVGDKKGPFAYDLPMAVNWTVFLDVKKQDDFLGEHALGHLLPWNHFGRKNLGYLFAVLHGAAVVFDFDDDNMLISNRTVIPVPGFHHHNHVFHAEVAASYNYSVMNPYPLLGASVATSWPRGYPLEQLKTTHFEHGHDLRTLPMKKVGLSPSRVGVVQFLANHDPDVDAIYRLTQPLPLDFPIRGYLPLMLPERNHEGKQVFCPYNAQATLHTYEALWTLLLPVTVHGRVSDIWRSYFAQRVLTDVGEVVVFHPPTVVQFRNSHNYLADFDSEAPLYLQSGKLVEFLSEWFSCALTLPGRIEELWVAAYERGYIGERDVRLMQAWLDALLQVGYVFPTIKHSHPTCPLIPRGENQPHGENPPHGEHPPARAAAPASKKQSTHTNHV